VVHPLARASLLLGMSKNVGGGLVRKGRDGERSGAGRGDPARTAGARRPLKDAGRRLQQIQGLLKGPNRCWAGIAGANVDIRRRGCRCSIEGPQFSSMHTVIRREEDLVVKEEAPANVGV